jgi:hypothetical protein
LPPAPTIEDLISDLRPFDWNDEYEDRPLDYIDFYAGPPQNEEQRRLRGQEEVVTHHTCLPYRDKTKQRSALDETQESSLMADDHCLVSS